MTLLGTRGVDLPALGAAPPIPAATNIAAMLGVTERKPALEFEITSLTEFVEAFGGEISAGNAYKAAEGFFKNGSVANPRLIVKSILPTSGAAPGSVTLKDRHATTPADTLLIEAAYLDSLSSGNWGNRISVDIADQSLVSVALNTDTGASALSAILDSVSGLEVGQAVLIDDSTNQEYRILTEVNASTNTITWVGALTNSYAAATPTTISTVDFKMTVYYRDGISQVNKKVETWENLSMESTATNYVETVINKASKYIKVTDQASATAFELSLPSVETGKFLGQANSPALTFVLGADGAAPADANYTAVLAAAGVLDKYLFSLIFTPETNAQAVISAGIAYAGQATRGDCSFLFYSAKSATVAASKKEGQKQMAFDDVQSYGKGYREWLQVDSQVTSTKKRVIPPVGHVAGRILRNWAQNGIHRVPAGMDMSIIGVLGIDPDVAKAIYDSTVGTDLIDNGRMNVIEVVGAYGLVIVSSVTPCTDINYKFSNNQSIRSFIKVDVAANLKRYEQRGAYWLRDSGTGRQVAADRMAELYKRSSNGGSEGAFAGAGSISADKVYTVDDGPTVNPNSQLDLGIYKINIHFKGDPPATVIEVGVGIQTSLRE